MAKPATTQEGTIDDRLPSGSVPPTAQSVRKEYIKPEQSSYAPPPVNYEIIRLGHDGELSHFQY